MVTPLRARCLAGLAGLGLAACGASSVTPEAAPEVPVTLEAAIRPEAAVGEEPFGRIADIEIGRDGSVYVLDALSRTIRVFDAGGNEVGTFGRRGQGPGEFERPDKLLWGPDEALWVFDPGVGRLTAFTTEGDLSTTARPVDMPLIFSFALGFGGDTLRWVGGTSPDLANPAAGRVESRIADGQVRPLGTTALSFAEWPLLFEHQADNMVFAVPVPFGGQPIYGFDGDGRLWYAHTASPRVHRVSESGAVDLTIEVETVPTPVTPADREEALSSPDLDEVRAVGASAVQEIADLIPDIRPFLDGFFFGEDGHVWVIQPASAGPGGERRVDIFDGSGTRVAGANVLFDPEPRPRLRDGLLAAVVGDDLGVESVLLYRVGAAR